MNKQLDVSLLGPQLSEDEFVRFQRFILKTIGLNMPPAKRAMLAGRLQKRLLALELNSYGEYLQILLAGDQAELQRAIDLITTHETYFFREPKHFSLLRDRILPEFPPSQRLRVWSAAAATCEEAYSIAMVLAEARGDLSWEVMCTDVSASVLATGRRGLYPIERASQIPEPLLKKYCLKGGGEYTGTFLIERKLRNRMQFVQLNLKDALPDIGQFDIVFLRNVIIYFDNQMKRQILENVVGQMRPGGWLIVGHAESLLGGDVPIRPIWPTVYRKVQE